MNRSVRIGEVERTTSETAIRARWVLDGQGSVDVSTGLGFLDHMLAALVRHSRTDLVLRCEGDLQTGSHHTVEDVALVLGACLDRALGDRGSIRRFGCGFAPMDEALARVVLDLSGRPAAEVELGLRRERLADVACEDLDHFFRSFAVAARCGLHVDLLRGRNDHHRAEAAFKALALALREAVVTQDGPIASTKGVL